MNYETLTAKQALEIAELREQLEARTKAMQDIHMILVCIGGPLNDNMLGYSKEQLGPLFRIDNLCDW